jgi:hypothetical protein
VDRTAQRELQHIGLPTACAVIHSAVTGNIASPLRPVEMHRVLDDVAHLLSNLVPIYAPDPDSGMPRALAPIDLIEGQFSRGAHLLRTTNGRELRGLTIRRRDMLGAIRFLKSGRIRLR